MRLKNSLAALLFFSVNAFAQQAGAWYYARAHTQSEANPDSAIIYYQKALQGLTNKNGDSAIICYGHIGDLYANRSDLQKSFTNYLAMLRLVEKKQDTAKLITSYNSIAIILTQQRKYIESIRYTKMSIELARKSKRQWQIMNGLANLSDAMALTGKSDSSIQILQEALAIARTNHFEPDIPNILSNLGNVYYGKGEDSGDRKFFTLAANYSQQAINLLLTMKNPEQVVDDYRKDLAYAYGLNGAAQAGLGNYDVAEAAYQKAIPYYQSKKNLFDLSYLYYELTHVYINAGKNSKAIDYLGRYDSISRALYTTENTRAISDMQTKYESEKKEQQNIALKKDNELSMQTIHQQKLITYFTIGGLVMLACFAIFILRGYRQKQRANEIITKQKHEVEKQKELIEEKQKEILDSIHYARRIQRSLLTSERYISRTLSKLNRS